MGSTSTLNNKEIEIQREMVDAKLSQNRVKEVYDSISNIYDVWANLTETRARNRALELAEIEDGQNILEVAAGTGLAFKEIVKRNPSGMNIGIDISEGMLRKAERRLKNMNNFELKLASASEIPCPDSNFDIVFNNYMFDLIPFQEMSKIVLEFWRVLKTGGKLVLVNMAEGSVLASKIYTLIYKISPRLIGGCRPVAMEQKLTEGGFEVLTCEYIEQLAFPSEVILAKKP